jgi:hypothetical protein
MNALSQRGDARPGHRWRRGPRLSTLLLLGFVAAALLGGVALMWQTILAERSQREQAVRTNQVLLALRDISRTAVNAETGQRGYLITLDRRYLAPFVAAREQYRGNLARLREQMGQPLNPRQSELLAEIERLSDAKFAELGDTVSAIEAGNLIDARRRILTDEGQDVMERLRRAIATLEAIEVDTFNHARNQAIASEARIVPTLLTLLALIVLALGLGLLQVIRAADAEARAAGAQELALARDRADLLARELNHRVKNLLAVVLAIVKMSGRDSPEAKPTIERIAARIHALLTAHEVTQGTSERRSAHLAELVETALKPYASPENRHTIGGPPVDLPERQVVPLGLVLHELATNAVKYGAWLPPGGEIAVSWTCTDRHLRLEWAEFHDHAAPQPAGEGRRGFGSSLIDGSARQLGGTIERRFGPQGIAVLIEFPLAE